MGLIDNFRSSISKVKTSGINKQAEFDVMYSSGFLAVDYLNGTVVHVQSKERGNFSYNSTGIVDGSTNTIIGRSGSGKSTLLTEMTGNIVRPFIRKGMNTGIFIDDIEGSLPAVRKEFLLGLTADEIEQFVDMRNTGITSENVFQRIVNIHKIKTTNPGLKKIWRFYDKETGFALGDIIAKHDEIIPKDRYTFVNHEDTLQTKEITNYVVRELQVPIFKEGELVYTDPSLQEKRAYCHKEMGALYPEVKRVEKPHKYIVDLSNDLRELRDELIRAVNAQTKNKQKASLV